MMGKGEEKENKKEKENHMYKEEEKEKEDEVKEEEKKEYFGLKNLLCTNHYSYFEIDTFIYKQFILTLHQYS